MALKSPPPRSKGERTRERIVAQVAPLFNQRGFAGASMADLIAVTGLQAGGVYRHFAGKEALAIAAFDHASARHWAFYNEAVAGVDTWVSFFAKTCTRSVQDAMLFEERVGSIQEDWRERLAPVRRGSSVDLLIDATLEAVVKQDIRYGQCLA